MLRADRPPSAPREASERTYTPGSAWWPSIRMRSPRMAPPEKGLLGSTASTPTVLPCERSTLMSTATSVLLPLPGLPVRPSTVGRGLPLSPARTDWSSACPSAPPVSTSVMALDNARISPPR